MIEMTASQSNRAARGTKRLCQACEVRFYDLWRDPIVCPSCGAQFTPTVQPTVEWGKRATPATGKTGWRRSAKRPGPVLPAPEPETVAPAEAAETEDLEVAGEVANTQPEDDTVLDQDGDDSDFTGLVELDVARPKEG